MNMSTQEWEALTRFPFLHNLPTKIYPPNMSMMPNWCSLAQLNAFPTLRHSEESAKSVNPAQAQELDSVRITLALSLPP